MTKRIFSLLVIMVLGGNMLFAQSVDDGKKFLYYERYKSAKETFEQVLAAKPDNDEAAYWLGQVLLDSKDSVAAKDVYQKALAANGNSPLLLVGMGQIELMEGKLDDARQRFETAINLTKGKSVDVFNAIGRANVKARKGDARYAVEKLNQATQIKRFKNAETYLIMGEAYRKLIDGGNAVTSFNRALELDPKLAAAKTRIGKVYVSQKNPEYYLPAFEEAVQLDENYAPAYNELFYHWYYRDVNKAGQYLDKYIANSDQGPETEYIKTDYTYAKGDFAGAKKRAEELIAQYGDKVNPRMYRMIAYTADTLGDQAAAKTAMNTFLEKADAEDILPTDYEELAKINSKIPGAEQESYASLQKAIDLDTALENKIKFTQVGAELAKKLGDRNQEANWYGIAYALEKEPGQTDLYKWAYAHYQAGNYPTADSLFCGVYQSKYPEEIYGYLWCARAKQAMDTTMEQGLAVEAYKTLAEKALTLDSGKFKSQAIFANFYLVSYYNDIEKDMEAAISYVDKVLEIDPANADGLRIKDILTKAAQRQSEQKSSAPKTKSTSQAGSTKSSTARN